MKSTAQRDLTVATVMPIRAQRRIVPLAAAAQYLSNVFEVSSLRKMAKQGRFPARKRGGAWFADLDQVDQWFDAGEAKPSTPCISLFEQAENELRSLKSETTLAHSNSKKGVG